MDNNEYMKRYYRKRRKQEPWWGSFISMKCRCSNKKKNWYRKGIKCLISVDELKSIWIRDKAFDMKHPSLDRIDNNQRV